MLHKNFYNQTELTVSSEELNTFILYKNSGALNHSFITPMNANLTHKNIVLYCFYMFWHILICQMYCTSVITSE
jgi:hypothetical protein